MSFVCEFCRRSFVKENSMVVHVCEPKRRRQIQHDRGVQLGFQAYLKFYQNLHGSSKLKTYADFADSPYFRAFAKFGQYCIDIRAINTAALVHWLIKHNKKIDHWCRDSVYSEYLKDHLKYEPVGDALSRAIEWSIDWQERNNCPSHDCIRFGNTNVICFAITTGHLSPWVIYNSASGQNFLNGLDPSYLTMIWDYVDTDYWTTKFKTNQADALYAQEILKQAGW